MKKIITIYTCIIFSVLIVKGQNYDVTGSIADSSDLELLSGATITLTQKENPTIKYFSTSNNNGTFKIEAIEKGSYNLIISYIGYQAKEINISILKDDINLKEVFLAPKASLLPEIQVTGETIAVLQKGDTTQYNANSYKTKPDATAEELLEKMPGMFKKDGKIQAQGEDVKKVLVDGQPFFGDDPNSALKNIPSEIIEKIEVFDQESEQSKFTGFDDGNTMKTINIITKKEFKNGTFGNGYLGYGYDNKYSAGGAVNRFNNDQRITILAQSNNINQQNFSTEDLAGVVSSSGNSKGRRGGRPNGGGRPGSVSTGGDINDFLIGEQDGLTSTNAFGINYSDKFGEKTNLTASYFFNNSKNESEIILRQQFFSSNNNGQEYYEAENSDSENINHRMNLKLEYNINDNNSILITPKLTLQSNNGSSNLLGETTLIDSILNNTISNFKSNVNAFYFSNSILWRHKFDKRGRTFSIDLSQYIKNNYAESYLDARNSYYSSLEFDTINQNANLEQYEQSYSVNFAYTEPIGRNASLLISYNPLYSTNNSDKKTYDYDFVQNDYNIIDTALSNITESYYTAHKIGAGVRIRKGKSMFMVNAFYELANLNTNQILPENSDITKKYGNILPMAMWRYRISQSKNIRIFYRSNTLAPSVIQLQEVVDNSNPVQLSIGNSNLDQEYHHNLFIKYSATNSSKNSMFFAMLSGSFKNSYIANNTTIAYNQTFTPEGIVLESGTQLTRLQNLDGYYSIRVFATYGKPISKIKSNLNLNILANFSQIPGIINDGLNIVNTPTFGLGAVLSSNISEKIDFTFGSTSSINYTFNSLNTVQNSKYFNQTTNAKLYYNFFNNFTFRTEIVHQYYNELTSNANTNYFLWNISIGSKLFKNKRGELLLTIYDILNQNTSINRISTETYIQDSESMVLNRYVMLTFRYRFIKV